MEKKSATDYTIEQNAVAVQSSFGFSWRETQISILDSTISLLNLEVKLMLKLYLWYNGLAP